jgi:hypothetical protein
MRFLSIKNYATYQHYKDRNPPWVKLHAKVLNDYQFSRLQDASKAHLMLLWVLASRHDNRIPYDLMWLTQQLGATSPIDVDELVAYGFIEVSGDDSKPLAPRKQSADVETERETEGEKEKETTKVGRKKRDATQYAEPAGFGEFWRTYPKRSGSNPRQKAIGAYRQRLAEGVTPETILAGAVRFGAWCEGTGKVGTELVMQASRFVGPDRHFEEAWEVSAAAPAGRLARLAVEQEAAERETAEWLARKRASDTRAAS